jgi:hypothetical protein
VYFVEQDELHGRLFDSVAVVVVVVVVVVEEEKNEPVVKETTKEERAVCLHLVNKREYTGNAPTR